MPKPDVRPLQERADDALAEIRKVLAKFNVDLAPMPQFKPVQEAGGFLISATFTFVEPPKQVSVAPGARIPDAKNGN